MAKFTKDIQCKCCNYKLNLFCHLEEEELDVINNSRYEVYFNKGEMIFKQGGPLTHIACITDGMAKVYLEGEKSKNIILKVAKPTELVGGPGFQVDNRHHFSVSAITNTKACFIDILAFEKVLKESKRFSMEFIKHINSATIQLYQRMQGLTQKQMHGRIADTILYLSKAIYDDSNFETTLSRQDLADLSSMTKESAIRILKEFKEGGIIDCEANHFRILNESQLYSISNTG